jgi:peroxiredoxin
MRERGKETIMAHSSPSPSRKRPGTTGAETPAQKRPQTASRSARLRPPRRRLLPRIAVLAVTLALLVGIIALVRAASLSTPSSNDTATTTGASTGQSQGAPDFTLPLLSGTTFHLAAKLGHVVVLYFMAPTCTSCAQGSRDLARASLSVKTQGAEVLAIDVNPGDRPADLQAFVQSDGIPASALMQWGVDPNDAITSAYNVQTLETTVVIDTHGQVAYRSDGSVSPDQLAQIVKNLT